MTVRKAGSTITISAYPVPEPGPAGTLVLAPRCTCSRCSGKSRRSGKSPSRCAPGLSSGPGRPVSFFRPRLWADRLIGRVPVPPTRLIDKTNLPKHAYADDCRAGLIAPDFPMEEVDLVFLKKSREFLEQHVRNSPGKPFFLFHSAQAVHLPSFAAPQFKGASK